MRDYHEQRRGREPLVRELYGLGLTAPEIAEITRWSVATVQGDIQRLGGQKACPDRPHQRVTIFASVIRRYAEIVVEEKRQPLKEASVVHVALATWLHEDAIIEMLRGAQIMLEQLSMPRYPEEWSAHAHLLSAVYGLTIYDEGGAMSRSLAVATDWWHSMLVAILSGEAIAPQSREQLEQRIMQRVRMYQHIKIMPIWDRNVLSLVDGMLDVLCERERKAICERFGIGTEAKKQAQIAVEMDRTGTRVYQIMRRAIGKLRVEADKLGINAWGYSIGDTHHSSTKYRVSRELVLELRLYYPVLDPYVLLDGVEELYFSARTTHGLKDCGVVLIGELVQLSPRDLLRSRYFGRKSLREVEEKLASIGATLGMVISENFSVFIKMCAQERRART